MWFENYRLHPSYSLLLTLCFTFVGCSGPLGPPGLEVPAAESSAFKRREILSKNQAVVELKKLAPIVVPLIISADEIGIKYARKIEINENRVVSLETVQINFSDVFSIKAPNLYTTTGAIYIYDKSGRAMFRFSFIGVKVPDGVMQGSDGRSIASADALPHFLSILLTLCPNVA